MKFLPKQNASRELEMQIISTLAYSEVFSVKFYSIAKSEHFQNEDLRSIYVLAKNCFLEGKEMFPSLLDSKISPKLYSDCTTLAPLAVKPDDAANQLRHFYVKERLKILVADSATAEVENPYDFIATLNQSLLQILASGEKENSTIGEALRLFEEEQKLYADNKSTTIGFPTGISKLDEVVDGFRNGHFWVIGGYTSTGKTFCALNMATTLLRAGTKVAFYSLEMSKVDIAGRMLAILSGIPSRKILKSSLGIDEVIKAKKSTEILAASGMLVYTKIRTLDEAMLSMLSNKLQRRADVFFIDYGQLMSTSEKDSEYQSLTKIATQLQGFAQKQNIPIILISQISNESAREDGGVIGFKGSGALAASADIAIILKSGESSKEDRNAKVKKGEPIRVTMDVRKNRHGRCGEIDMLFHVNTGIISEYNKDDPF